MIAKKYRIEKKLIDYILKKGESALSGLFIVKYSKNDKNYNRYSTITSKKIDSKATERNLIRRRIYEAIRNAEATNSAETSPTTTPKSPAKSKDIILIPKKQITTAKYEEIEKDIREIITKL